MIATTVLLVRPACPQYDVSREVCVGPTTLPSALPADTTPSAFINRNPGRSAENVMRGVAKVLGYRVEVRAARM